MVKSLLHGLIFSLLLCSGAAALAQQRIVLASTTSTENSGLFAEILPLFTDATGIEVHVVAVGTGAALRLGRDGDADILLVHARAAEDAFVTAGYGAYRRDVMFNDFVIVGPTSDPAGIGGTEDAPEALRKIAEIRARFLSRGDDSGTHKAELRLWQEAGLDPAPHAGDWYLETGSGMGSTLNTAAVMGAYLLADRGTWLSFANRAGLAILVAGDAQLFNPYGIILVSPDRHPHLQTKLAETFIDWLTGPIGQSA
ncbi:MAG: substrate-binding domain-containing protein, partial [Alphaproteobacteria bacterium]